LLSVALREPNLVEVRPSVFFPSHQPFFQKRMADLVRASWSHPKRIGPLPVRKSDPHAMQDGPTVGLVEQEDESGKLAAGDLSIAKQPPELAWKKRVAFPGHARSMICSGRVEKR
jgi:hypothetical protein